MFQRNYGSEKVLKKRGQECQKFSVESFFLSVPKYLVGEQPFSAVFQKISGSGKCLKETRGVSKASLESFLSHSAEKFRRGSTLMCVFEKISGSEKVLKNREKECQKFQSRYFCLTVPKNFGRGTTLLCCVSENFWQRKF